MKHSKNNRWLISLMIISQIMLIGLVIQWLRFQWLNEKESLKKDISLIFKESTNQVLDSLLIKDLISPVLKDSAKISDNKNRIDKNSPLTKNHNNKHIAAASRDEDIHQQAIPAITLADSLRNFQDGEGNLSNYESAEKDLFLRSIKLLISQTKNSSNKENQFRHIVTSIPDTALLKRIFDNNLRKAGKKFGVRWISSQGPVKEGNTGSVFYFETYMLNHPFGAEVTEIQKNILKGISAQILFALILSLVTASAFFFNYKSLKKMATLNTLRNDFIGNITHELKTPVATVSVALEALKNYNIMNDPAKTTEYLDIAWKEMDRLKNLVTQVLNSSILEEQNQFIKMEEVDLITLTREVMNSMQVRFSQQKAKVEFQAKNETCILNLDKLHIQGVIINLLDNSLKYAVNNPVIRIKIEESTSSVLLKICDNGEGIPEKYLSRIFDKFFRVPKGDYHNIKGYGLGLSYAKLVMKYHSGSISVRNLREGGCEFSLTFPKPAK